MTFQKMNSKIVFSVLLAFLLGLSGCVAAAESSAPGDDPPNYVYDNGIVRIEVRENSAPNIVYFTAEIWLSDPKQLQSAFSMNKFNAATESVEDIAERNGAILAINGDFATFNEGGIILRNGEVFRKKKSTRQLLVIDQNGDFIPYQRPPKSPDDAAKEFLEQGVWQTLVFGPVLVENGEAVPIPEKFFLKPAAREPRTAIAQIGPLHYLWMVVDGRQDEYSQGVSMARLQELLIEHGAQVGFNLDGGGSSTLYFNGNIINRPANGGQRKVPDILFIAK